jgi:restriction endonuclease S subunit
LGVIPLAVVSHLACITPKEDISEYLRLYFTFHKPNQLVKDAAYPSISLADIGNIEIDIPDEQTRGKCN